MAQSVVEDYHQLQSSRVQCSTGQTVTPLSSPMSSPRDLKVAPIVLEPRVLLDDDGAKKKIQALERRCDSVDLDLQFGCLGPSCIARIVRAIVTKSGPALLRLDLRGNYMGNDGAKQLAVAIQLSSSLKTMTLLGLAWNCIGDDGAAPIGATLRQMDSLVDLNLAFNRLSDSGAHVVADGVEGLQYLTLCDLSGNCIGPKGAEKLKAACR